MCVCTHAAPEAPAEEREMGSCDFSDPNTLDGFLLFQLRLKNLLTAGSKPEITARFPALLNPPVLFRNDYDPVITTENSRNSTTAATRPDYTTEEPLNEGKLQLLANSEAKESTPTPPSSPKG